MLSGLVRGEGHRYIVGTGVARDPTFLMTSVALLPMHKLEWAFRSAHCRKPNVATTSDVPAGWGESLLYSLDGYVLRVARVGVYNGRENAMMAILHRCSCHGVSG